MSLGTKVGFGPGDIVLDHRWGPSFPSKGHSPLPQFSLHVCSGQMAGWIKMPLRTEKDLSPGHILLDGNPYPPVLRNGTAAALRLFGPYLLWQTVAHVSYC